MGLDNPSLLATDGEELAFVYSPAKNSVNCPLVVWLGGFRSDMSGIKASEISQCCIEHDWPYLRLDYRGHGQSTGRFEDATVAQWTQDALHVIEHQIERDPRGVVLIGSSMGAWIMARVGLALGERLQGMLGIASAPDFTEGLLWDRFSEEQKEQLQLQGSIRLPSNYDDEDFVISQALIEDGRRCQILHGPIDLNCPVRLIHGQKDVDVPYEYSLRFAQALTSHDIVIELVKNADHRLSTPTAIGRIKRLLEDLMREVTSTS